MSAPESAKTKLMWPANEAPKLLAEISGGVFRPYARMNGSNVGLIQVNNDGVVSAQTSPSTAANAFYNAAVSAYPGITKGENLLLVYQAGDTIDLSDFVGIG